MVTPLFRVRIGKDVRDYAFRQIGSELKLSVDDVHAQRRTILEGSPAQIYSQLGLVFGEAAKANAPFQAEPGTEFALGCPTPLWPNTPKFQIVHEFDTPTLSLAVHEAKDLRPCVIKVFHSGCDYMAVALNLENQIQALPFATWTTLMALQQQLQNDCELLVNVDSQGGMTLLSQRGLNQEDPGIAAWINAHLALPTMSTTDTDFAIGFQHGIVDIYKPFEDLMLISQEFDSASNTWSMHATQDGEALPKPILFLPAEGLERYNVAKVRVAIRDKQITRIYHYEVQDNCYEEDCDVDVQQLNQFMKLEKSQCELK